MFGDAPLSHAAVFKVLANHPRMTSSYSEKTIAGPSGFLRPCSQLRRVWTLIPIPVPGGAANGCVVTVILLHARPPDRGRTLVRGGHVAGGATCAKARKRSPTEVAPGVQEGTARLR